MTVNILPNPKKAINCPFIQILKHLTPGETIYSKQHRRHAIGKCCKKTTTIKNRVERVNGNSSVVESVFQNLAFLRDHTGNQFHQNLNKKNIVEVQHILGQIT